MFKSILRSPIRSPIRSVVPIYGDIWTPAALFTNGQQGVWYEPKPQYLYQDAAGTTPVTADGDPVGLMLDLHKTDGRGVVNKFTWTEAVDNSGWTKVNGIASSNVVADPNGAMTADEFIPGGVDVPSLRQAIGFVSSVYTVSAYFKKNATGLDSINFSLAGTSGANGTVNIETGQVITSGSNFISGSSESVGGGWYRVSAVLNNTYTGSTTARLNPRDATGSTFIGDGISGVYVWGLQIELGDTLTEYQANTASVGGPGNHATQSTSAARPIYRTDGTLHWLEFDGVDDYIGLMFSQSVADFFIAVAQRETARQNSVAYTFTSSSETRLLAHTPYGDGNYYFDTENSQSGRITGAWPKAVGQMAVTSHYRKASDVSTRIDGVIAGELTSDTSVSADRIWIMSSSAPDFFNGDLFGFITVFADSSSNVAEVESYLSDLQGRTL